MSSLGCSNLSIWALHPITTRAVSFIAALQLDKWSAPVLSNVVKPVVETSKIGVEQNG